MRSGLLPEVAEPAAALRAALQGAKARPAGVSAADAADFLQSRAALASYLDRASGEDGVVGAREAIKQMLGFLDELDGQTRRLAARPNDHGPIAGIAALLRQASGAAPEPQTVELCRRMLAAALTDLAGLDVDEIAAVLRELETAAIQRGALTSAQRVHLDRAIDSLCSIENEPTLSALLPFTLLAWTSRLVLGALVARNDRRATAALALLAASSTVLEDTERHVQSTRTLDRDARDLEPALGRRNPQLRHAPPGRWLSAIAAAQGLDAEAQEAVMAT